MTRPAFEAIDKLSKSFTPHRPIDLPDLFSGRIQLLLRAQDAVNTQGLHVVLFGDRGTGKTSLAHVLGVLVQEPATPNGRRSLLMSCNAGDTFASIWRKVFQEILVAERQLSFVADRIEPAMSRLDVDNALSGPNDVRLALSNFPNRFLIVIDEFDRVTDVRTKQLMADTIKLFSDSNVRTTIMLVGVADSLADLISEHQSIARSTAQIDMEPMGNSELREIVQRGFGSVGFTYSTGLDERIASMSQGYPAYTHLLGLWTGRVAAQAGRTLVTAEDLAEALPLALENVTGGVQFDYEKAVASSRENTLFEQVLLACAVAAKDSVGRFSAVDVKDPLRKITGKAYGTSSFQSHLAKFCEPERGPIMKKSGNRRNYRWQFTNPQIVPYIKMRGVRSGLWKE